MSNSENFRFEIEIRMRILNQQIKYQKRISYVYPSIFIVAISIGIIVSYILHTWEAAQDLGEVLKIGPGIILASISAAFQLRPFLDARLKYSFFTDLSNQLRRLMRVLNDRDPESVIRTLRFVDENINKPPT